MKKSAFQFKNPQLKHLYFVDNPDFQPEGFEGMKIDMEVTPRRKQDEPIAFITLALKIGEMHVSPFYIEITMGAEFSWTDEFSEQEIEDLLNVNAPVLLMSYIRPIISSVTSESRFPTFYLPFLNFNDNKDES